MPGRRGACALRSVFRAPADAKPVRWLARNGARITEAEPFPRPATDAAAVITNSFTIAAWVKPDTDMMFMPTESAQGQIQEMGRSYVVTAPEGDLLYGPGHAAMGIAAGRNGVVYHFYCAEGKQGRVIALATSKDLRGAAGK